MDGIPALLRRMVTVVVAAYNARDPGTAVAGPLA